MKGKWVRFKIKICELMRHRWDYYLNSGVPQRQFRCCRRCQILQEWRVGMPAYGDGWVSLVMRTKKGAQEFLAKHPDMNRRKLTNKV